MSDEKSGEKSTTRPHVGNFDISRRHLLLGTTSIAAASAIAGEPAEPICRYWDGGAGVGIMR